MAYVTIEEKVSLDSKFLDKDVKSHLYRYILGHLKGKNTEKYGYILDILPNIEILKNEIFSTGTKVRFHVRFGAKILKPEEGNDYEGEVSCVLSEGIFVVFQKDLGQKEEMKVFIPVTELSKFKFDRDIPAYKDKKKVVKKGSIVRVKITKIKSESKIYIGSLKDC